MDLKNAGTGGNRRQFGEGAFLFSSASRLELFLWDPFFMVCQMGLWAQSVVIEGVQRAVLRALIPDGQILAGSQTGTRLNRASVLCSWKHGQSEASWCGPWTLNPRQQQQGGPCAREDVASPSLQPPLRALISPSEMTPAPCSLHVFWISASSVLASFPHLGSSLRGQDTWPVHPGVFPKFFQHPVSQAAVNVINY